MSGTRGTTNEAELVDDGSGGGSNPHVDPSYKTLIKILGLVKANKRNKTGFLDDYEEDTAGHDSLQKLSGATSFADLTALSGLNGTLGAYKDPTLPDWAQPINSQAANAKADPNAIKAQSSLLSKIMGLTDTAPSAQEKFQAEGYRQQEENSNRGAREAILANMRARGVSGGGAELASTLDAQSNNARSRMLSDLGLQAQAQQRSQQMLGMGADLSGQIRGQSFGESFQRGSAADSVAQFNSLQDTQQKEFKYGAQVAAEQGKVDRATTRFDATRGVTGDIYDRGTNLISYDEGKKSKILGGRLQNEDASTAGSIEGEKGIYGYNEMNKAEDLAKPKENLWDKTFGRLF